MVHPSPTYATPRARLSRPAGYGCDTLGFSRQRCANAERGIGLVALMRRRVICAALAMLGVIAASGAATARIDLRTDHLGNVFAPGEKIKIAIASNQPSLKWTATDFYHTPVDGGTVRISNGAGEIHLKPGLLGWFEINVAATSAGGETTATDVAVLPMPHVLSTNGRYGVMTHFAQGWETDILPLVARAGIGTIRDELYWEHVETSRGKLAIPAPYQAYLDAAAREHLKLLLVLSFANPLYDGGQTPYSPEGIAAFAAYARFLVQTLGDRLNAAEVWNEFNGSFCTGPCDKDRPAAYTRILHAADAAIKAVRPGLPVGGGAAILAPIPWFQALFEHGALDDMNAIAIHPYRVPAEGTEIWLHQLDQLKSKYDRGRAVPIWATEFSHQYRGPEGPRDAARYLVSDAAIMLGSGVQRISWYLLRDYQKFNGMGLVAAPNSPRGRYAAAPAYVAYGVLIGKLADAVPRGREASDPRTRIYRFDDRGVEVRVAWSPGGKTRLVLDAPATLRVSDMMGNERDLAPKNGRAEITIGENPIYLRGRVTALHEPDRHPVLADSVVDYGDEGRDANGWSYGAFLCSSSPSVEPTPCETELAAGALEPLVWKSDAFHWSWRSPRYRSLEINSEGGHPAGYGGRPVWAVRRWTAPRAGAIRIDGVAARASARGDGTIVAVLQDGKPLWQRLLGGHGAADRQAFSLPTVVKPGTKLDFVTTPGPGGDVTDDATALRIIISAAN
jgi:hypothetical protein